MSVGGITPSKFTQTEMKILNLLSDGMKHLKKDLSEAMYQDREGVNTLSVHVTRINKILRPIGQEIITQLIGRDSYYRHVRLLVNPNDGKR